LADCLGELQPGIDIMTTIQKLALVLLFSGVVFGFLFTPSGLALILVIQVLLACLIFLFFSLFMGKSRLSQIRLKALAKNGILFTAVFLYVASTVGLVFEMNNIVQKGIVADESGGDGTLDLSIVISFAVLILISSSLLVLIFQQIGARENKNRP
jgi:glucan phosphoethanolaminetransferase (alkaline phosphatase superfamily)